MSEWTSLKKFDGEDNSFSLVGGVATVEPENIEVKCPCPNCGKEFISDKIEVPAPNFFAEKNMDIAKESYTVGAISSLQLREIQKDLLGARLRLLTAKFKTKVKETELLLLSADMTF